MLSALKAGARSWPARWEMLLTGSPRGLQLRRLGVDSAALGDRLRHAPIGAELRVRVVRHAMGPHALGEEELPRLGLCPPGRGEPAPDEWLARVVCSDVLGRVEADVAWQVAEPPLRVRVREVRQAVRPACTTRRRARSPSTCPSCPLAESLWQQWSLSKRGSRRFCDAEPPQAAARRTRGTSTRKAGAQLQRARK